MKSDISIALFSDHLEYYSDTFELLLTSILLWEQLHWFSVWPWFWGEKSLVCVWIWFCFTSVMQKEGQLICHLKRSDAKSACFFLLFNHLLKSHKGVFRILKTENSFLNSFSRRKSIARISLCSSCPPSLSVFLNTRATAANGDAAYVYNQGHNKNEKDFTVMQM